MNGLLRKVHRAYSDGGVRRLSAVASRFVLRLLTGKTAGNNRNFDDLYAVDTSGRISTAQMEVEGGNWRDGHAYQPTLEPVFDAVIKRVPVDFREFAFMDIGCGKGAALLYAAKYPFKKICGVDFSRDLCDTAKSNIAIFKEKTQCPTEFDVICLNVLNMSFPDQDTVFYLFNPFQEKVLVPFVRRLSEEARNMRRQYWIAYYTPAFKEHLKAVSHLEERECDEQYVIYRCRI